MTFQPATNTAMVELKFAGPNGLSWQNNIHFTKTGFDEDDMDDLNDAVEAAWGVSDLLDDLSTDVILVELICTDMRTQGASQRIEAVGNGGTKIEDMVAQGTACVATLRTDLRGRSYRGRFYLAGVGETLFTDGAFDLTVAQNLQAFLESVQTLAAAAGWTMVVLSRWFNEVERLAALGQEVTSILIRQLAPGSQRRRNQRG